MTERPIRRRQEVLVYENPWIRVYFDEVERGGHAYRQPRLTGVGEETAGAVVVAQDPARRVALVRISRYPPDRWFLELRRGNAEPG